MSSGLRGGGGGGAAGGGGGVAGADGVAAGAVSLGAVLFSQPASHGNVHAPAASAAATAKIPPVVFVLVVVMAAPCNTAPGAREAARRRRVGPARPASAVGVGGQVEALFELVAGLQVHLDHVIDLQRFAPEAQLVLPARQWVVHRRRLPADVLAVDPELRPR